MPLSVLIKLGAALSGWVPRSGGGDPLAVVRAAWPELVGPDVARAAQPVAIAGETLVVITSSSSWSHQLAFLEPQIMRGLRTLDTKHGIARLRFRVGTIRAQRREVPAPAGVHRRSATGAQQREPRNAGEALARFRAAVERSRAAHQAAGGSFCQTCAAPIARGSECVSCHDWANQELRARCQRLLFDAPWLTPQEVLDTVPGLDATMYDAIRRQLLRAWYDEMKLAAKRAALPRPIAPDRARLRKIASSFVLLETKIDPKQLEMDSPIRRNALGDVYEFIRSVEEQPPRTPPVFVKSSGR